VYFSKKAALRHGIGRFKTLITLFFCRRGGVAMARILQRLYFCFGIFLGKAVVLFELAEELVTLAVIEHDVVVGEPKHVVRRLVELIIND